MKYALRLSAAAFALIAAGCGAHRDGVAPANGKQSLDWHRSATANDRQRLRGWRTAWTEGLAKARASKHDAELAREGVLLDPDAAVQWRAPPDGLYSCRTIKIGAQSAGMLDYVAYPAFDCRIRTENGVMRFAKLTGSQRPIGLLLPQTPNRMIFLGTLQLGDETRTFKYGGDQDRDLAAMVERIGESRWRLVFPYPHFESTIDVMELVPKGT
jgi:hypothetical protein